MRAETPGGGSLVPKPAFRDAQSHRPEQGFKDAALDVRLGLRVEFDAIAPRSSRTTRVSVLPEKESPCLEMGWPTASWTVCNSGPPPIPLTWAERVMVSSLHEKNEGWGTIDARVKSHNGRN